MRLSPSIALSYHIALCDMTTFLAIYKYGLLGGEFLDKVWEIYPQLKLVQDIDINRPLQVKTEDEIT